jgi:hypothetical protein
VQCHGAGRAGQAVNEGGVVEPLGDRARLRRMGERREPRARRAVGPRGRLDDQLPQALQHAVDVDSARFQAGAELVVGGEIGHGAPPARGSPATMTHALCEGDQGSCNRSGSGLGIAA